MALDEYGIALEVKSNLNVATAQANALGGSLGSMIGKFGRVAIGIGSTASALMVLKKELTEAYRASMDFNKGLANVATLIPGNTERILQLKDSLRVLSVETGKSLGDLTDGLYQTISAFGDMADTEEKLAIISKSAIAGMASTTDALNLLSAVTKAYGDTSAGALAKVSDLAFETLRLGQTTYPELASAIQVATDASVRMGVSQEELFASLATLTGVSGGASEVMTQLRGALIALEGPSKDLQKLYDELGIASGSAMIEQYGLAGSMEQVMEYSRRTGTGLQALVGRVQAMSFASNIGSTQSEVYARKLGELAKELPATDKAFAEITDGINKQGFELEQLSAQWEVLRTTIGDKLSPIIGDVSSNFSRLLGIINAQHSSVYLLEESYESLINATENYDRIINQLQDSQTELTDIEERMLNIRKEQAEIDLSKAMNTLARSYEQTQRQAENYEQSIVTNTERQKHWTERIEELRATLQKLHPESRRAAEVRGSIEAATTSLTNATLNLTDAQNNLRSITLEDEASIIKLAEAYNAGKIDIDAYAESFPELYNKIKTTAENIANTPIVPDAPSKKYRVVDADAMLDSFIGFSAKQLKDKLEQIESLKAKDKMEEGTVDAGLAYRERQAEYDEIILGLKNKIAISEKEFVDTTKEALGWQLKALDATEGQLQIDYNREKTLADINKQNGENAELTELVNELFDKQGEILQENYAKQISGQLEAIRNENELIAIDLERERALQKLVDLGIDTEDNIKNTNALYDIQKTKILDNANEAIDKELALFDIKTSTQLLEEQRVVAIEEANKKYGEQSEIIAKINALYDKKIEKEEKSKNYNQKIKEYIEAQYPAATATYNKMVEGLEKVASTLNEWSFAYDAISNSVMAWSDTNQKALDRVVSDTRDSYNKQKSIDDEEVKGLEDKYNDESDALQEQYDKDLMTYEDYTSARIALQEAHDTTLEEAYEESTALKNKLLKAEYEAEVASYETEKSSSIASAIMAGAQGIMQSWSLGWPLGAIGAGIVGIATAAQIGAISSTEPPKEPTYLAQGGIATRATNAIIGEAGEPEMVLPLSKAESMGFGGSGGDTINISGNTFVGIDGVDELLIMLEKRKGILRKRGLIA